MHATTDGMVWVPGGSFRMGSDRFYPEERPVREVEVEGLWIDREPVTVASFRRFVEATGHVTLAERDPDPALYPGAHPSLLVAGSLVFVGTPGPVPLDDHRRWWRFVAGASWQAPEGPGSDIAGRADHPVVHIGYEDAAAYAAWAGKALPTEAEWERAARGDLDGCVFTWGDDPEPGGAVMANTWQGRFPYFHDPGDPWPRTSPAGSFPPNGFGLHDMTGNVWEWTVDRFAANGAPSSPCCAGPTTGADPFERRVIKGGSHLCSPEYCLRYRPAARQSESLDTSTSHIGFRCVVHHAQ
jgi:formylglycine-generating enzyme required for sulfatase activity